MPAILHVVEYIENRIPDHESNEMIIRKSGGCMLIGWVESCELEMVLRYIESNIFIIAGTNKDQD